MSYFGRPDQGAALCDKAYRLNPLGAPFYAIHCFENYIFTGRHQDALAMLSRSESWIPYTGYELHNLAAAQAENGDADGAAATVAALKRDHPGVTAEGTRSARCSPVRKNATISSPRCARRGRRSALSPTRPPICPKRCIFPTATPSDRKRRRAEGSTDCCGDGDGPRSRHKFEGDGLVR
jgi:hypothetical protein